MSELLTTLASILVPVAGCVLFYRYHVTRTRRILAARATAAEQLGWEGNEPDPWLVAAAERIFALDGTAHVMFTGEHNGHTFRIVDYTYLTRTGKAARVNKVHLVAVSLPVSLPLLAIDQEQPLLRAIGLPDLELESNAFNENFWVRGPDQRFASAVLHPRMMEWMLQYPDFGWLFDEDMVISPGRGYWDISQALQKLDCLTGVVDRLPPFVLADYAQPPRP